MSNTKNFLLILLGMNDASQIIIPLDTLRNLNVDWASSECFL